MNLSPSVSSVENLDARPLVAVPGYKPSGAVGPLSAPLVFATSLVVPPLAAFLYDKTAHFGTGLFSSMWTVLIGAALLGALTGAAFFPAIHLGKMRNANLAAFIGLLAGLAAFTMALGIEATEHRDEVSRARTVAAQSGVATTFPAQSRLDLTREYLGLRAESGLQVTGRRGRGANINGSMFWALLGIEGLLSAIAATLVMYFSAGRRYSEERNRWFISKTPYNVLPHDVPAIVEAAQNRDFAGVAQIATASKDPNFKEFKPPITIHYVPEKAGGILEIRAIADPKKPVATVYESELSNEELKTVWPAFPARSEV
ncbi:MAG TPA: hypothetical protein VGB45_02330 [Abditibacterium sp.]|jgi:hypothetical protein